MPAQSATADREIVISRIITAPDQNSVFEAIQEVRHLSRWWGPEGFTTTTRASEFRVGGVWDFVMHWTGLDGLPGVDLLAQRSSRPQLHRDGPTR